MESEARQSCAAFCVTSRRMEPSLTARLCIAMASLQGEARRQPEIHKLWFNGRNLSDPAGYRTTVEGFWMASCIVVTALQNKVRQRPTSLSRVRKADRACFRYMEPQRPPVTFCHSSIYCRYWLIRRWRNNPTPSCMTCQRTEPAACVYSS